MDAILLGARLLLTAVFATAGAAKLLDLPGSRRAMQGFGVPARAAGMTGVALPVAELAIAALLLPRATAWWGALAAAALLATFIAAIAAQLARGRTPDCHCFGQLHSEPVGIATLARNAALLVLSLAIVVSGPDSPGASAFAWLEGRSAGQLALATAGIALAVAIGAGWWLTLNLLGQNGRILARIDALEAARQPLAPPAPAPAPLPGLPVGAPAPAFALDDLDGNPVTLDALRAIGKPVLAIFASPTCGPCVSLLPDIARWQREYAGSLTIALISSGTANENRAKIADLAIGQVLLDPTRAVSRAYDSHRTPAAVLIRPDGAIGSPLARGAEAIRRLAPSLAITSLPAIGMPAPAFALPDLDGRVVSDGDFAGRELILLFWSPTCGFCRRMLPALRDWIASRAEGDPAVALVSTGTVEENRAMGIDAPILLDEEFATGRVFGARGTPAAVRIAADGTLASRVAAGAPAIVDMLGASEREQVITA